MSKTVLRILVTLPFPLVTGLLAYATGLAAIFPWSPTAIIAATTSVVFGFSDRIVRFLEVRWLARTGVSAEDIRMGMRMTSAEDIPWHLRRNRDVYAAFLMLAWRLYEPNDFARWSTRRMLVSACALSAAKAEHGFDVEQLAELIDLLSDFPEMSQPTLRKIVDDPALAEDKMTYFRASKSLTDIEGALRLGIPVEYLVAL